MRIKLQITAHILRIFIDILSKILLCLPVKSIIALKIVCKQWDSVISDSSFQKSVEKKCRLSYSGTFMPKSLCLTNRFKETEHNFLDKDATSSVPLKTWVFGKSKEGIKIEQSCNGLLLCSSKIPTNCWGRAYYVYNPYTGKYKLIPRRCGFCSVASVRLAFDPSISPYYKVISLWSRRGGYQIDIYSSQTSSSKNCGEKIRLQAYVSSESGVYLNGSLNWMSSQGTLVYFEVDQEVIKHLAVTTYVIDGVRKRVCYFDVCRGHLQMIVQNNPGVGSCFDVLEMDTAYTGWDLKYRMDLESRLKVLYPDLVGDSLQCSVMLYDEVDTEGEGSPKLLLLIKCPLLVFGVITYDINDMHFRRIHSLEQPCICMFPEMRGVPSLRLFHYTGRLARV
ncbi:F-box protein At5g07610-like [Papaver somniferum]|uniref:F-box protein At5g07610-like n=1 Tax=Papaver somniferum TaxID=3469 RepID=UPI000E700218|nr:F-box protein At5g07610-like [Papaver somniferum]